ncbi:MAG TPA: hypothetical protein PLZ43_00190 [bacterium]|nr:hypothetical protein [bacterium]
MADKNLLILETEPQNAAKYSEFLKDTSWVLTLTGKLDSFAELFSDGDYSLIIVEEKAVTQDVLKMLFEIGTPLIISTDSQKSRLGFPTISRNFTRSELTNTMGRLSFSKVLSGVSEKSVPAEEIEDPVILEPVFEGDNDEAMILSPEDEKKESRSSFEITDGKVESSDISEKHIKSKKDIFDRIDEIDSIMMSLTKDITDDSKISERPKGKPIEKTVEKSTYKPVEFDPPKENFDKTEAIKFTPKSKGEVGEGADFLFDDDYKFEENKNKQETGFKKESETQKNESVIRDFESILSDKPVKREAKPEEYHGVESVSALEGNSADKTTVETEPVKSGYAESGQVEQKISDDSVIKAEVKAWLEKNGRTIIKEIVEEHLARFAGK